MTSTTSTRAIGATGAVLLSVLLAGCSAGSSDEAAGGDSPEASTSTPATTPGEASCDLEGAVTGTVQLTETSDSYEVVFTGLPVDGDTEEATFQLILGSDDGEALLSSEFVGGAFRSATAAVGDDEGVDVPDAATASGDVVTAVYPKSVGTLADFEASDWTPEITFSVAGASDSVRCGDGTVLPYEPLG